MGLFYFENIFAGFVGVSVPLRYLLDQVTAHCPKNTVLRNLGIKTEPVMVGADATVYGMFRWCQIYACTSQTYTVATPPVVRGSVFVLRFSLFLAKC